MSQRKAITDILTARRRDMIRYAEAVSGDAAGAEDLVQDAWVKFDRAAQDNGVAKPAHLFWRILRNLSIDRGRRIAHENRVLQGDDQVETRPDEQPSIEHLLIAREELARIRHVVDGFDPRTRAAFEMHRFEGAKLREIAAHLGISTTSAHGLVTSALRQIRDAVDR